MTFEQSFDNQGTITLSNGAMTSGVGSYEGSLVDLGTLTNDGTLMATGMESANSPHTIAATELINNGLISNTHDLSLFTPTLINDGSISIGSGTTMTITDGVSGSHTQFTNHGDIVGGNGAMGGYLDVTDAVFVSDGVIKFGDATDAGTLHVTGDMTLLGSSHMVFDVNAGGVGSTFCDQFQFSGGTLTLGGELDLSVHNAPNIGESFSAISLTVGGNTSTVMTGEFTAMHGLDGGSGSTWLLDPTWNANGLSFTVESAANLGSNATYSTSMTGGTYGSVSEYVVGGGSNEIVHLGGGNDVYIGHGGYNQIGVTDLNFHFLDGGAGGGNELMWENQGSGSTAKVFDVSKIVANALQHFDVLNLSNASSDSGNAVLDLAHVLTMTNGTSAVTGTTNSLVVIGGNNSSVSFNDSGWHQDGQVNLTVDNHQDSYTQYSNTNANGTTAHVLIDSHTHVH